MTTAANSWKKRYATEVANSIVYYNWVNQIQPVNTRQMTRTEIDKIFGSEPNYIKGIKVDKTMMNKRETSMTVLIDDINKVKRIANIAMSLPFYVDAVSERWRVSASSLLGLLSLDVSKPIELRFDAENEDRVKFAFSGFEVKE